jgi:TRAP-type mannitol/chloroaromatic compound transport system permease large subunit
LTLLALCPSCYGTKTVGVSGRSPGRPENEATLGEELSLARDVPLWTVYKGVIPFILADVVRLALLVAFPILSTLLPSRM